MSKNPAWNAYNESVRTINEEYEKEIKPLSRELSEDIAETEARFDAKINPLVIEKRNIVKKLQDNYTEQVIAAETIRRNAIARAHSVRNAELEAAKSEQVAA